MHDEIAKLYGERLRIRVCGLLFRGEQLLLINHRGLNNGDFWAPPGGGVEYGESIEQALKREFLEETGLIVTVKQFAFGCEFIREPLHAIELFFWIETNGGSLSAGRDPELQIIAGIKFFSPDELHQASRDSLHGVLRIAQTKHDFKQLTGFYRI